MAGDSEYDAVVIGSGPNGLTAAVTLAQRGRSVLVLEANDTIGGGTRSAGLTLPGFTHDVCSAIHPMAAASPALAAMPLDQHGLEWIHPTVPLAHPFDDGPPALLCRDLAATGESFGLPHDDHAYADMMRPWVEHFHDLAHDILGPLGWPDHPLLMARFGMRAILPASRLCQWMFRGERAKALFAGIAGHSLLPMEKSPSSAIGLVLAMAGHAVGWPLPRGGSQSIANALASYFRSLGGEVRTGCRVTAMHDLPPARAYLFDTGPHALADIAGDRLPGSFLKKLLRYRYGPGVFKLDYALDGPIPWKHKACADAGTVHLGGTMAEIAASERAVWRGDHAERPYILLAQQSLFDDSRAPMGKHTAWAYCHVPNGSTVDMTERIEAQIERFAPGFRDRVLARHALSPHDLEVANANLVGGDVNGGATTLGQLFARPVSLTRPYRTPNPAIYLCSASTPPGGGVHGMCGHHAARTALRHVLR